MLQMYIVATRLGNLLKLLLMDFVLVHSYAVQSSNLVTCYLRSRSKNKQSLVN